MGWKPHKKKHQLSIEDQESVKKLLEATKRFIKPIRGEIVYKAEGSKQEVVQTSRYFNEEDVQKDAEETIARMNAFSKGKKTWKLISAKVVGRDAVEEDKDE